ncbi:MAG: hypothetical protein M5U12_04530 [Verrucomicrobia bacterium]|nr:hypothetical protein [Verrucomicrobiota bacterium]
MSSDRANTNTVESGWPTRLEDVQATGSPVLTDNLYRDGFSTNVATAFGGHPHRLAPLRQLHQLLLTSPPRPL